jgi:hypothetical protein
MYSSFNFNQYLIEKNKALKQADNRTWPFLWYHFQAIANQEEQPL